MTKRPFRYFSQNGEDYLLWNTFNYKPNGFYVDIGAFDGVHLSNTYSFEQQGWNGICVEPNPEYYAFCLKSRPQANCLNIACVADDTIKQVELHTEKLGLLSGLINDEAREEDVKARYQRRGLDFDGFKSVSVRASTLTNVLNEHLPTDQEIDFISIDVEGTELDVLKGLDFNRFRPRVFVIEATSAQAKSALSAYFVRSIGYIEARALGENIFYARDAADAEKLKTVSINCKIEGTLHPLGTDYTLPAFMTTKSVTANTKNKTTTLKERLLTRMKGLITTTR